MENTSETANLALIGGVVVGTVLVILLFSLLLAIILVVIMRYILQCHMQSQCMTQQSCVYTIYTCRKRKKTFNVTEPNLVSIVKNEHGSICNIGSETESTLDQSNKTAEETGDKKVSIRNNLYESRAITR